MTDISIKTCCKEVNIENNNSKFCKICNQLLCKNCEGIHSIHKPAELKSLFAELSNENPNNYFTNLIRTKNKTITNLSSISSLIYTQLEEAKSIIIDSLNKALSSFYNDIKYLTKFIREQRESILIDKLNLKKINEYSKDTTNLDWKNFFILRESIQKNKKSSEITKEISDFLEVAKRKIQHIKSSITELSVSIEFLNFSNSSPTQSLIRQILEKSENKIFDYDSWKEEIINPKCIHNISVDSHILEHLFNEKEVSLAKKKIQKIFEDNKTCETIQQLKHKLMRIENTIDL